MHLPKKCKTFLIGLFQGSGIMLFKKVCNNFQEENQVPLPPLKVIVSHHYNPKEHQEPEIFHVSHDSSCRENPPSNLAYENLKHRRKNKCPTTFQEVSHFEL